MVTRRLSSGILILTLLLVSVAIATAATPGGGGSNTRALFEQLKKLEGDWQATWEGRTFQTDQPFVLTKIRVIAAGSVVEEVTGTGNTQMASFYHMDGNDLVITHLCNLGNQPQYRLSAGASKISAKSAMADSNDEGDATTLSFNLVRVSNLNNSKVRALPSVEGKSVAANAEVVQYMRLDWIKIVNPDLVKTHWTILRNGKTFAQRVTTLKRIKA